VIRGRLDEIDGEVVGCVCRRGPMSARQLAEALGVSALSAVGARVRVIPVAESAVT